jgi:transketolase
LSASVKLEANVSAVASPVPDSTRPTTGAQLDQLSINCRRPLSIDVVQQAKSGHPGTPMAPAPLVCTLWNRVMRFDPQDPIWPNRDRLVLSNGHTSMLLWSILYLSGTRAVNADYERTGEPSITLDDIRSFRQLSSKAPGHPEYHWVSGVETTSGPLGCGDGCLMEGVSSEAASLAGHLGLDDLCWIYDNNHITIEGNTRTQLACRGRWRGLRKTLSSTAGEQKQDNDIGQTRSTHRGPERSTR